MNTGGIAATDFELNTGFIATDFEVAGFTAMDFEERRTQLLKIFPKDMRRELFRRISDFKDLASSREWIRVQCELESEWAADDLSRAPRTKPVNLVDDTPAASSSGLTHQMTWKPS